MSVSMFRLEPSRPSTSEIRFSYPELRVVTTRWPLAAYVAYPRNHHHARQQAGACHGDIWRTPEAIARPERRPARDHSADPAGPGAHVSRGADEQQYSLRRPRAHESSGFD